MIYPLTSAGAQIVYIGLSLLFWDLAFLCGYTLRTPQTDKSRGGIWLLISFATGCACMGMAFTLSIVITGAQPMFSRDALSPWIRLCYWGALLTLAPAVIVATLRASRLMLGLAPIEEGSNHA